MDVGQCEYLFECSPKTCHLCLSQTADEISIFPEDEELRVKMDKVFYFQVTRSADCPCLVCDTCKETVNRFYEYAEQVWQNQLYLPSVLNPSEAEELKEISKCSSLKSEQTSEQDQTEWIKIDACSEKQYVLEDETTEGSRCTLLVTVIEPCLFGEKALKAVTDAVEDEKAPVAEEAQILKDHQDMHLTEDQAQDNEADSEEDQSSAVDDECGDSQGETNVDEVLPKPKYRSRLNQAAKREIKNNGRRSKDLPDESLVKELMKKFELSCDLCLEPLANFIELQHHYRNVHNEQGYLMCCGKKIYGKYWMIQHVQVHLQPDAFRCEICCKNYSSSKVLRVHMEQVHSAPENRPVQCETCLKRFVSVGHLNTHIGVAHGSIPCPLCPRTLASEGSLKKHMKSIHDTAGKYICNICAKVYRDKECFEAHVNRHSEPDRTDDQVQCEECSAWFTDENRLMKHYRLTHVKEVSQPCEACGKLHRRNHVCLKKLRLEQEGTTAMQTVENDQKEEEDQKHMSIEEEQELSQMGDNVAEQSNDCMHDEETLDENNQGSGDEDYTEETRPKRKYVSSKARTTPKYVSKGRKSKDLPEWHEIQELLEKFNLSCDLCSLSLKDFTEMKRHYRSVHKQPAYLMCCSKKIFEVYWMIQHIQLHLNPDAFRCEICNKKYSSSKCLRQHVIRIHSGPEDRQEKCETCQKLFTSVGHLNTHVRMAHGSIPCPQCPRVLASEGSLKKHLKVIHGEADKYVCDICSRVYRSKDCFETHIKRHLGTRLESKVQCEVCSGWFVDKNCLTKHMQLMHVESEDVLDCTICGRQYRNQKALTQHMGRAHGNTRYECQLCQKQFRKRLRLTEHIAIHHTGEEPFECHFCSQRFNTKNKRYTHAKVVHPAEYEELLRKRMLKEV